jgi:hypothetical protein
MATGSFFALVSAEAEDGASGRIHTSEQEHGHLLTLGADLSS